MSEFSDGYRRVAAAFTTRVEAVPDDAWDNPAPCQGWMARDVVGHLVEWLPGFLCERWGIERPEIPDVADDPAGAWAIVNRTFQAALDDPGIAAEVRDTPMGPMTFEQAFDMIATNDVFVHAWDLARATGLDESLDPVRVHAYLAGAEPMDEMLRQSGQYGPRVTVSADADEQTRLIAFLGRQP